MQEEATIDASAFLSALIGWYERHGRDLPWRHTHDPYAIWLSEIILQQTRIAQGQAYWERFMQRFPTVQLLAEASEDEVLKLWQGLGYYSRARNLHAAARQIVAQGRFPNTLADIQRLKGVGPYTASAIAAFAFNRPAVAIDGNAYRVFARLMGIHTPINSSEGQREFRIVGERLFGLNDHATTITHQGEAPWRATNSALMDLGATLCTPQAPACPECPLEDQCVAYHAHLTDTLPVKQKTVKSRTRHLAYVWARCQGHVALHRRGEGDIWQGLWEPFNASLPDGTRAATPAELLQLLDCGAPDAHLRLLSQGVKHVLTHRILLADFYLLEVSRRPLLPPDYIWIPESEIDRYGVPRLIEKMLSEVHGEC